MINSYHLYQVYIGNESLLTHLEFRTALYTSLLGSSLDVKIHRLELKLGGKRTFGNDRAHIHQVSKRRGLGTCVWCSYSIQLQRRQGGESMRASRSWYSYSFCDAPLRISNNCWPKYHRLE